MADSQVSGNGVDGLDASGRGIDILKNCGGGGIDSMDRNPRQIVAPPIDLSGTGHDPDAKPHNFGYRCGISRRPADDEPARHHIEAHMANS